MIKTILGFLIAVIATHIAGTIFISQGNLAQVAALGLDVTLGVRIEAAFHDMTSMTGIYLPVVGFALLIAFIVARLVIGFVPNLRLVGYTLAGGVAMISALVIAEQVLVLAPIAPARFLSGLLLQGLAGAIGGLAFHFATLPRSQTDANAA